MKIFYDLKQLSSSSNSFVFLDTNCLIGAFVYPNLFSKLFDDLKQFGCEFLTISSVVFEFTRGTKTIEEFNSKLEFLENLASIYQIEKHLEDFKDLTITLQKIKGTASYTDFLLIAALYKFRKAPSYLLNSNHNDCPLEILDREAIVTVDTDKDIKNYGIYKFSDEKYNKATENILKARKDTNQDPVSF